MAAGLGSEAEAAAEAAAGVDWAVARAVMVAQPGLVFRVATTAAAAVAWEATRGWENVEETGGALADSAAAAVISEEMAAAPGSEEEGGLDLVAVDLVGALELAAGVATGLVAEADEVLETAKAAHMADSASEAEEVATDPEWAR